MSPVTIVMMVLVLGVVWGGFAVLLFLASRLERQRRDEASGGGDG